MGGETGAESAGMSLLSLVVVVVVVTCSVIGGVPTGLKSGLIGGVPTGLNKGLIGGDDMESLPIL